MHQATKHLVARFEGAETKKAPKKTTTKKKYNFSRFFFTINSNVSNKHENQKAFEEKFAKAMDFMYEPETFKEFLFDKKNPEGLQNLVEIIKPMYKVEIGHERGFIHCHSMIRIVHRGQFQINRNKIMNFLREAFKRPLFVSYIKGEDDDQLREEWYINKSNRNE